jgi:CDP-paratose 2-epimerase
VFPRRLSHWSGTCRRTVARLLIIFDEYKGKQVRDNIHSFDLVNAFWHFFKDPRKGEVYNIGGGRYANCSMLEAIALCEELTGQSLNWSYTDHSRVGDHIWWISDIRRFQSQYPG